jgi:hypothetical protein
VGLRWWREGEGREQSGEEIAIGVQDIVERRGEGVGCKGGVIA